jgi:hypothetical protein
MKIRDKIIIAIENILLYRRRKKYIGKRVRCYFCGDPEYGTCTGVYFYIQQWWRVYKDKHYRNIGFPIYVYILDNDRLRSFYAEIV